MRKETGGPDQMVVVVRDMINDPYASLPPKGVQHPVILPLSNGAQLQETKGNPDLALV